MACIPAGQRVRLIKTAALQNMGTEPDPKRQLINSLILRCRAYQTKLQDGAGRGLFRKPMRWTRSTWMYECRLRQGCRRADRCAGRPKRVSVGMYECRLRQGCRKADRCAGRPKRVSVGMHECRRSQATERSEEVPVVRAAADLWYVRNVGAKCRRCPW